LKDKILFWLGNDYTHFCLANELGKKYDCDMYGIVEVTNRPRKFFEKQKLVNFKELFYFHDNIKKKDTVANLEYLEKFEKKYNLNLWTLVQNERIFLYYQNFYKFSSKEMLNILEQECRFFETILEKIKPDFFFTKISSLHHQELFYQMCRNSKVNIQLLTYSPLSKHCLIMQHTSKLDHEEISENTNNFRSFKQLQKYLHSFELSKQLNDSILKPGTGITESFRAFKEYLLHSDSKNLDTHYTYYGRTKTKVLFNYMIDFFRTRVREQFINKNLNRKLDYSSPYVFFPLHTEIERSLLIAAPFYVNQIETIRSIAKSLPINFKLYVKEHPAQIKRSWRKISEYKDVMDIPNVVFVHPKASNEELYKNCSLIISIAGTTGFEGTFYGKPVITFEQMYYSTIPTVKTLQNLDKLSNLIKESLELKPNSLDLDKYVKNLEKNIINFDYAVFLKKLSNKFFYGGNLVDVNISEVDMEEFLKKNQSMLEVLVDAHISKIQWFKKMAGN